PGVQEELKLKDEQKTKLKALTDSYDGQMRELRNQMGFGRGRGPGGNAPGGGPGAGGQRGGQGQAGAVGPFGGGQIPPGGGGLPGGGFPGGGFPNPPDGGGIGQNANPNFPGPGAQVDPERAQRREMMRQAMTELRENADQLLGRILTKGQLMRIKQIQLQLEG